MLVAVATVGRLPVSLACVNRARWPLIGLSPRGAITSRPKWSKGRDGIAPITTNDWRALMADHPVAKHLDKLAQHHRHTRERHHADAVRLTADREVVDRQEADRLAGRVGGSDDQGSDHGAG